MLTVAVQLLCCVLWWRQAEVAPNIECRSLGLHSAADNPGFPPNLPTLTCTSYLGSQPRALGAETLAGSDRTGRPCHRILYVKQQQIQVIS